MKILKIKNKVMYKSNNPEGSHYYAMYYDKKHKKYNAVLLTHIANRDSKKYSQADHGFLKTVRIKNLDKYADSGITPYNYITDVEGKNLNYKIGDIIVDKVSPSQEKKIKSNIKYIYSEGKKFKSKNTK